MKSLLLPIVWATSLVVASANVAPTVAVSSAAMRPGTTLMDITYKVTDPDDATVKVRALAFVDGTRSFYNVIRPVTWAEGTETNIGDAITTNVNHTLTWNVAADWTIDLGNIKVEILARDTRGLLPLDWITIPAAGGNPAVTISNNVPTDAQVLDALFWLYADGDTELVLTNGNLIGTPASGLFSGEALVSGNTLLFGAPLVYLYKRMNVSRATGKEKGLAIAARAGIPDISALCAANRPWNEGEVVGMDPTAVATNIVSARWVRNTYADGSTTINDRFSGLMWVSYSGEDSWFRGPSSTAVQFCENLVYAGYDDWVLPSIEQLLSMVPWATPWHAAPCGSYVPYSCCSSTMQSGRFVIMRYGGQSGGYAVEYWDGGVPSFWPMRVVL